MRCQAMRLREIPPPEERRRFYDAIAAPPGWQERMYVRDHEKRRWEQVMGLLESLLLLRGGRVLEVGCADGLMTASIARRADWVVGVDVAAPCIERCEALGLENASFFCGTLAEFEESELAAGWRETGFDLAVASEVLEHTEDPAEELDRMRRWARWILASVPITEIPNETGAFSVEASRHPRKQADGTGHVWYFRPDTFKALFSEIVAYQDNGVCGIVLGR